MNSTTFTHECWNIRGMKVVHIYFEYNRCADGLEVTNNLWQGRDHQTIPEKVRTWITWVHVTIYPIPSMGLVYLPPWMVDFDGFHVGKYTNRPLLNGMASRIFRNWATFRNDDRAMRRVLQVLQIWSILWRRGKRKKKHSGFLDSPEFGCFRK